KFIRRVAVASYELEINQVVHSEGGTIKAIFDKDKITIIAKDRGPGIPDLDKALTEGFSTANDWIRSLGFGAGMGLPNSKRVSDDFLIESSPKGTKVTVIFNITEDAK
ncbi:MAG: histidine kinase, partial [Spirochaetales bacterium]|nr:histidine kinase [Spirochaetales bacterium]